MQNIIVEEQNLDGAHGPISRRNLMTTGGLLMLGLVMGEGIGSGTALAHSGTVLRGRSLLKAMVDRAFIQLKSSGGFWDGPARLPLPEVFGAPGAWMSPALTDVDQREKLHHWLNVQAFEAALGAQRVFTEAAHELPLKVGHEKYKGKGPASEFLRRMLGPAVFNVVSADLYAKIASRDDPFLTLLAQHHAPAEDGAFARFDPSVGLGASAKLDAPYGFSDAAASTAIDTAIAQLSHATENAIWAAVQVAEVQLRS